MNPDRPRWEERYSGKGTAPVRAPSLFLQRHLRHAPPGRALDLACGDGRNAALLAAHGFVVDAIDFARAGLVRAQAIARQSGLAIHPVQADLESFPLPVDRYALAANIRYLQRSLWAHLKRSVVRGGVVVVETFLLDQQEIGNPSNPAFLLERGELAEAFADFALLTYEEGLFQTEDDRAFLARMVARRAD